MMATCLALFLLAGLVVRHFSGPLAALMCVVAAVIPPAAAIVANAGVLEVDPADDGDDRRPRIDPDR